LGLENLEYIARSIASTIRKVYRICKIQVLSPAPEKGFFLGLYCTKLAPISKIIITSVPRALRVSVRSTELSKNGKYGRTQYKIRTRFYKAKCAGKVLLLLGSNFLKFRKGFFGFRRAGRVRKGGTAGFGILGGLWIKNT